LILITFLIILNMFEMSNSDQKVESADIDITSNQLMKSLNRAELEFTKDEDTRKAIKEDIKALDEDTEEKKEIIKKEREKSKQASKEYKENKKKISSMEDDLRDGVKKDIKNFDDDSDFKL